MGDYITCAESNNQAFVNVWYNFYLWFSIQGLQNMTFRKDPPIRSSKFINVRRRRRNGSMVTWRPLQRKQRFGTSLKSKVAKQIWKADQETVKHQSHFKSWILVKRFFLDSHDMSWRMAYLSIFQTKANKVHDLDSDGLIWHLNSSGPKHRFLKVLHVWIPPRYVRVEFEGDLVAQGNA